MTEHNNNEQNGNEDKGFEDSSREERINALLDGDLDPDEAETLKAMATQDKDLMRAITEAYQLQRAMEHVRVEKAPARLRRRLKQIPRQNRAVYLQPRWVAAFAIVPLMIIAVALMRSPGPVATQFDQANVEQSQINQAQIDQAQIDQARVKRARQELAVAFAYIDNVSAKAGNLIASEVGGEMSHAVAGSIFKSIRQQKLL